MKIIRFQLGENWLIFLWNLLQSGETLKFDYNLLSATSYLNPGLALEIFVMRENLSFFTCINKAEFGRLKFSSGEIIHFERVRNVLGVMGKIGQIQPREAAAMYPVNVMRSYQKWNLINLEKVVKSEIDDTSPNHFLLVHLINHSK